VGDVGAIPAAFSVWLVPRYGWEMIFLIGGLMPLALACVCRKPRPFW